MMTSRGNRNPAKLDLGAGTRAPRRRITSSCRDLASTDATDPAQVSPEECAQFEAEFAEGLARASAEFDLAPAEAVLDRWWGIAAIRVNPLSEQEAAQVAA